MKKTMKCEEVIIWNIIINENNEVMIMKEMIWKEWKWKWK